MAFVIKSKKGSDGPKPETGNIGPGEYIGQGSFKEIKPNKEPFLSSSKRINDKVKNNNPGPGTYYQDDMLIKCLKNLYSEKLAIQNDKDSLLFKDDIVGVRSTVEKLGFTIKAKRFKYKETEPTPGPGFYFPKILSKTATDGFTIKNNEKNFKSVLDRVPVIPGKKEDRFLYEFNKKTGNLHQAENPEMYKTFSGEKGDTVGPGTYDIDVPSNWHKTGTEWSKFKVGRDNNQNKMRKTDNRFISMQTTRYSDNARSNGFGRTTMTTFKLKDQNKSNEEPEKNQGESGDSYVGADYDNVKFINEKKNIMNCRMNIVKKDNERVPHVDNNYLNNLQLFAPGPGYYFGIEKQTSFKQKNIPEYKQFFGSKAARFPREKANKNVGPTTYFLAKEDDQNKIIMEERNSRIHRELIPFNTKAKRFKHKESKSTSPGPGSYQLQSQFINKKMNKTFYKFGSNQIRFFEDKATKNKNLNPGPGAYSVEDNNLNKKRSISENPYMRFTYTCIRNDEKDENLRKLRIALNKDKVNPPVGTYNPGVIFSINYNNEKRVNQHAVLGDVAFNTRVKKRFTSTPPANLGPGYYYKDVKVKSKQVYPPFSMSDRKLKGYGMPEFITGPGQYNIDSYFDWNKRTYNVNYI